MDSNSPWRHYKPRADYISLHSVPRGGWFVYLLPFANVVDVAMLMKALPGECTVEAGDMAGINLSNDH